MNARPESSPLDSWSIEDLSIATIRTLAMDAVQKANSGHPGTPMALAPLAYVLWTRFLRHNPADPRWPDRDRFVLSNGHASMLQYAMLYLTGYDVSLEDLKQFRQWGSKTPGHPEYGITPGVETTTGPLGQGLMTAVGMAIAEAHLAATFNRPGHQTINHHTYAFCSDGDLMEGASHEAASVAGHLGLGKLICVYDDNHITIDGETRIAYSDDVPGRFSAYGWDVQDLGDRANDLDTIHEALEHARSVTEKPSMIVLRSHIGYGAPHLQDTPKAHGSPLGEDEVRAAKANYGWPEDARFLVPEQVLAHTRGAVDRGKRLQEEWQQAFSRYRHDHPEVAARFEAAQAGELPTGWDADLPAFDADAEPIATRSAGQKVMARLGATIPWLIGGAADLASSTKTVIEDGGDLEKGQHEGRNLHWGIREHVMCAASSGMALHGGLQPFASTFFIFTDYARPAIRLAALMELPVVYVMTHDSIGLGEDGPTHQPIEHLASFRAMPNMCVIRPADANEVVHAWRAALTRRDGPTMLVLTRQKLPVLDRTALAPADGVLQGAYVLSAEKGSRPDVILIATGSEVHLTLAAQQELSRSHGMDARVVSMPSWELFRAQSQDYRRSVLPPEVTQRLAVEAGAPQGWCEWVGDGGRVIGITRFGASAPAAENFSHYGFTVDNIVQQAREMAAQ
ncbi:MAG: transketolase [Gammaproteobacteria bacterium]